MNQILMTEDDKPRDRKGFSEKNNENNVSLGSKINSLAKVFAILIIIFGLTLIGSGSYAVYGQYKENKNYKAPVVTAEKKGNRITITAMNDIGIRYLSYYWNSSNQITTVEGKNKTEVKATTNIIAGNNKLNVKVTDARGKVRIYTNNYIQEEQDITEPEVEISSEGAKIKITATDDTELSYIKYKYGENEEVKVEANEDDSSTIIAYIEDVANDKVTLRIEAVDASKNTKVLEQQIMGVKRPTIKVVPDENDPEYLILTVTAEEGLRMVSFYINEQQYQTDPNASINDKVFTYRVKADKDATGLTTVRVNAYSLTEQVQEFRGEYRH